MSLSQQKEGRMKKINLIIIGILLIAQSSIAQNIKVHREVLDNGLSVLLYENHQAPVVASRLFYKTGSVHETIGNTGIAHMLEHSLFKGTKKVGIKDSIQDAIFIDKLDSIHALMVKAKEIDDSLKVKLLKIDFDSTLRKHKEIFIKNELWNTYLEEGGTGLNAYTSKLMTAYFVTLPKNKVELFLWLEADRMQNAIFRGFYTERDVVAEERRMRVDDNPSGRYFEALTAMQYENHPLRSPTIGWPSDLNNYTREQAYTHYKNYYKPANAILVFAGDFNSEELMIKIKQYFGPIKAGKKLKLRVKEMPQDSEKKLIHRRNDAKPRYDLMFHTPAIGNSDIYVLDIIEGVLNGKSGRLYKRLVLQEKLAVSVGAGNYWNPYIGEFSISVSLAPGADEKKVEEIVWEELYKLSSEGISARELQKVKNQAYANSIRSLEKLETVASRLAYYEMYGDWTLINNYSKNLDQIKAEDINDVAKKYFQRSKSITGLLLPDLEALEKEKLKKEIELNAKTDKKEEIKIAKAIKKTDKKITESSVASKETK